MKQATATIAASAALLVAAFAFILRKKKNDKILSDMASAKTARQTLVAKRESVADQQKAQQARANISSNGTSTLTASATVDFTKPQSLYPTVVTEISDQLHSAEVMNYYMVTNQVTFRQEPITVIRANVDPGFVSLRDGWIMFVTKQYGESDQDYQNRWATPYAYQVAKDTIAGAASLQYPIAISLSAQASQILGV